MTFSLATLIAIMALCAAGFAIMYYTVGLGVAYFVIVALAFIRVKLHRHTAWVRGIEATIVSGFLFTLLIPVCCSVAFFGNCLAGVFAAEQLGLGSPYRSTTVLFWLAFGLGGITALQAGELVFALCLRKRPHETS